jgi:hypothetical protein
MRNRSEAASLSMCVFQLLLLCPLPAIASHALAAEITTSAATGRSKTLRDQSTPPHKLIIAAAASDCDPLGHIFCNTTRPAPKRNQAKPFVYVSFTFCNYAFCRTSLNRTKGAATSHQALSSMDRSTEQPNDRAIERPSDRALDRVIEPPSFFFPPSASLPSLPSPPASPPFLHPSIHPLLLPSPSHPPPLSLSPSPLLPHASPIAPPPTLPHLRSPLPSHPSQASL